MSRRCSICARDDLASIDEDLVRGVPLREIAKRCVPVTVGSLQRHSVKHVSPALTAVVVERAQAGSRSALDRLEELYRDARGILDAAKVAGAANLSLAAVRELRGIVESLARITGELDERPQVTLNLIASPEWLAVRAAVFDALEAHPDARLAVSGRLAAIGAGS